MLIDWVTVIAQIVNFLILVVALKFLLYDRVVRAMDARQQRIEDRLDEARRQQEAAEAQAQENRRQRDDIEHKRDDLLARARRDADRRREDLERTAREDVDRRREQWVQSLRDRRDRFLADLRRQAGRTVCDISRRALADLADADLERQVLAVFRRRVTDLSEEQRTRLSDGDGLTVVSAWPIPDEQRGTLRESVRSIAGDREIAFQQSDEVICGVELHAGGHALGWTVAEYLDELTEQIAESIDSETHAQQRKGERKE